MAKPSKLSRPDSGPSEPEIDYQTLAEVYWKWGTWQSPEEKLLEVYFWSKQ
jgi:hypothetical protein